MVAVPVRSVPRRCTLVAVAVWLTDLGADVAAVIYTYTPANTSTDVWTAGTDWSLVPVGGSATELTFIGSNTTVLANSLTNVNTDNISGFFSLNILDLQGTGPASGAATITIASTSPSTGLNFVTNPTGSVAPVVNLNALTGTAGLTYNVSAPITLAANTTFQGNGTATFKFSGGISGGFAIVKNGSSTLTLSGSNSYTAGTTINAGTLAIANDSALGTGTLTINDGGKLANNDTAANTITNVIALSGSTNGITFTGSQNLHIQSSQ